jgi:hypothetical protein
VATIVVERFLDSIMLILAFGLALLRASCPEHPLQCLLLKKARG